MKKIMRNRMSIKNFFCGIMFGLILAVGGVEAAPGDFLFEFGSGGTGNAQFQGATYNSTDQNNGNIIVKDANNYRVQVFDNTGAFQFKFGDTGPNPVNRPGGVAVDPNSDNIIVVDVANNRIQVFDSAGGFLFKFGSIGSGPGQFNTALDVAVDPINNTILVADAGNNRIQVFDSTGIYTVSITVTDKDGESDSESASEYIVIYDPTGGFVTGGGWIDSPEGAYVDVPSMTGKANFGFVSKYKKGAAVPTGETQFQFKAGYLNFHSDVYDWLVISGAKAKYKGVGSISGEGGYKFMLMAIDAGINNNDSFEEDRFRIKIWYEDNGSDYPVYDNGLGGDPEDDAATTEIGGGSIVIHKAKNK
jgi:hypothetical protein